MKNLKKICSMIITAFFCGAFYTAAFAESPHGLEPSDTMPYLPDLKGLRHNFYKNQYGMERQLSEGIVLRKSILEKSEAKIPAGGLYYISEVKDEVRPLLRDPFFVLGEHAYLVDLKTSVRTVNNIALKRGDKKLIDDDGYRMWFDYPTDHYDLPYLQLALISPAGHWPTEFPVSTKFPHMDKAKQQPLPNSVNENQDSIDVPQLDDFFMDPEFEWGASRFVADKTEFNAVNFSEIQYPVIEEATFSMSRPYIADIRQEDYRWYKNKRIYAFRQPDGFLIRVTNWSGSEVLGEKVICPTTSQTYKDRENLLDKYHFTLKDEDMRIEISIEPKFLENSDFMPTTSDNPNGWNNGILSLVVYSDLVTVKKGEAWPLDVRFTVGLEANLMTGGLQRLVLENAEPMVLNAENSSIKGPEKWSHVWNRPAFTLVANGIKDDSIAEYYVRDSFFQRTDNMAFNKETGRKGDMDFFIGRVPTVISVLEDTFLTRLADNTYSTVVEPSAFTSFPKVLSNMAFSAPDHSAPFQARMRGFNRKMWKNSIGENITGAEGMVIRGSYVDWRNKQVVIPPSGLYYTSRNARNVRAMRDEPFYILGKQAYLVNFESVATVKRNFNVDFWKNQPTGDMNPVFWQDVPVGVDNKMLRYTQRLRLDDHPVSVLNIVKYSGNNFGAPFITSNGLSPENRKHNRYAFHDMFAEGATWVIPEFIGENSIQIAEFGTPSILSFSYTYQQPKRELVGINETVELDGVSLKVINIDETNGTVTLQYQHENEEKTVTLGPLNTETRALLPQHQRVVHSIQHTFAGKTGLAMVEMDVKNTFENGKAGLRLISDIHTLKRNSRLAWDDRFMVRPDVCGHCYQLNELLIDNPDPIILDKDHPRYDGPKDASGKPFFTLVLDSFDGEMIHGWHIETTIKNRVFKSDNLAFNPRNNMDCLIGVNGTIEGFLRASMLERSAYQEYWRNGQHMPHAEGRLFWFGHLFQ